MVEPNAALTALLAQTGYRVAKVQPPDGLVVELADGTRWCVSAHRCGEVR